MFNQQQQQKGGDRPSMGDSFNALFIVSNLHALCVTVFLRRDFGREGIGLMGLGAAVLILGYGSMMHCYPMWYFFLAWVVAVVAQRIKQFQNWRNGVTVHSRYGGYPWLAFKLFPRLKSEANAHGVEAFLCLAAGGLLTYVSPPLGWFVMASFASIMFSQAVRVEFDRKRLQAMKDAEIEQRYLAERYKSGRF